MVYKAIGSSKAGKAMALPVFHWLLAKKGFKVVYMQ